MARDSTSLTKERDRFLRDIQVIAGLGTYVLDVPSGNWRSSDILDDILGIDAAFERSVESWANLLHPADREMMMRYFTGNVIGQRQPFDKEYRIVRRVDGGERWVHGRGRLELNEQGAPVRMIGTIQDITARKLTEESLRNSETRYRGLIDLAVDGILLGSHEGIIVEANQYMCTLAGMKRADLIGMDIRNMPFTPESLSRNPWRFDRLKKGEPVISERELIRPDGTRVIVEMRTKMMPDGTYQSIYRDITERKRADEAVKESQRALATLIGNLQGIAYRCKNDAWWTMEFLSSGVKDLTGYDAADLIGNAKLSYQDLIHPDDRVYVSDEVQRAIKAHTHFQIVYRIRTLAGEEKWVWEKGIGVDAPTGELRAIEGFITDITERKQAEDDLRRLASTLERRVAERTAELELANAALRKSHALLNDTGAVAHVGGWELDLRTMEQVWTDEVYRIHEVEREFRPTLSNGIAFYAAESRPTIAAAVTRAIEQGEPFDEELELITAKGHRLWVRAVGAPDTEHRRLVGIIQDVTERKKADEILKAKNAALDRSVVQLRELAAELTQAEERERKRLAGLLHDSLQPLLVAATIKISLLERDATEKNHAKAVQEVLGLLGESLEASRALTTDLYPPVLLDAGLVPGLRWLAEWMQVKHGLTVNLAMNEFLDVPEPLCILLFRATKELLLNVVKHARVKEADVEVESTPEGSLRVTVRDRGNGFAVNAETLPPSTGGFGLFQLRERLAHIGGALEVIRSQGCTEVVLTVPCGRMA